MVQQGKPRGQGRRSPGAGSSVPAARYRRPVPPAAPTPADAAACAAERAGVDVRLLERPPDLAEAHRLLARVWGGEPDVGPDLLRAVGFAGGYVAGAHRDGTLVGVSVALVGWHPADPAPHLHSHVTGAAPEAQGGGIGFALKQHQRAWALAQGFGEVVWTYDPLLRRNAWFNLARLGAGAAGYLVDFYGDMLDPVNAGQGSDRLLVRWRLDSSAARAAATGRPVAAGAAGLPAGGAAPARVLLAVGDDGEPVPGPGGTEEGHGPLLCGIPPDVEALRRSDPAAARRWRAAVRAALGERLGAGWRIAGFDRGGWYVLVDDQQDEETPWS